MEKHPFIFSNCSHRLRFGKLFIPAPKFFHTTKSVSQPSISLRKSRTAHHPHQRYANIHLFLFGEIKR
uniref:Uncharacterized protein n=1 Tax=Helianthus annuus TaxID=4232 RepID=A0A251TMN8_HELAN